jgi:hypothetical protein
VNGIVEWEGNRLEIETEWSGERTKSDYSTESVELNTIPKRVHRQFAASLGDMIRMANGRWPQQNINVQSRPLGEVCGLYVSGIYNAMATRENLINQIIPGLPPGDFGQSYDVKSFSKRNTACPSQTPPACGGGGGGGPGDGGEQLEAMPVGVGEESLDGGCGGGGGGGGGGFWVQVCTGYHVYDSAGNFLYDEIVECHKEYWVM